LPKLKAKIFSSPHFAAASRLGRPLFGEACRRYNLRNSSQLAGLAGGVAKS